MNGSEILKAAVAALDEKKADAVSAIDVRDICTYADYFVMATGTSSTHIRALSEAVEEKMLKLGKAVNRIEGRTTDWILMDYGDVIIHIFGRQAREFYGLEHLWNDGKPIDTEDILKEETAL